MNAHSTSSEKSWFLDSFSQCRWTDLPAVMSSSIFKSEQHKVQLPIHIIDNILYQHFIFHFNTTTHVSRTLKHSNCCGFIRGCLFFCGTSCGVFILSHQKYKIKHTTEGSVDNFLRCWRLKIDWNGFLSWIFWRRTCNRCVPFYLLTLETSRPQRAFMFAPVGAGVTGHVCLKAGVTASFIQGPRFAPLNIMWQW